MRKPREVYALDVEDIARAVQDLKVARGELRRLGCKRAAEYVQRAVKSAEGAYRHAEGLLVRKEAAQARERAKAAKAVRS